MGREDITFLSITVIVLGIVSAGTLLIVKKKKRDTIYENEPEQRNPMQGKKVIFVEDEKDGFNADGIRGHLESRDIETESAVSLSFYSQYIKRAVDVFLSLSGLIALFPIYATIALIIKIDDPGPVFFTQKRIGKEKEYFKLHKFRTMKMSTPHDVPTHMLDKPDQYITRVGKLLRKFSLDELPQLWDIFIGNMSFVGPRPALWNQDLLVAERDKYDANELMPGLTGWAQINGRDELKISAKARLDGEYAKNISFGMDMKCFLKTIISVVEAKGVREGGLTKPTRMKSAESDKRTLWKDFAQSIKEPLNQMITNSINLASIRKILITGTGSYIGESVEKWLANYPGKYLVTSLDMRQKTWREYDFSKYDVILHVAGIAHADVGDVTEEQKRQYYAVNTGLSVGVAKKAKDAGVKQFIFMSSMIVYSGCEEKFITAKTIPKPLNFYGDSKWQADQTIRELESEDFKVVVLRPPMIYGKGSKGNYSELAKLAGILPIFPKVKNHRSMLYIDNLCQFVKLMIDNEESGVFFPQNREYTNTSDMVQMIAAVKGHRIIMVPGMDLPVKLIGKLPGKIGDLATKAFGDFAYGMEMSEYEIDYRVRTLRESIILTERYHKTN